jgi:hypothetical protein
MEVHHSHHLGHKKKWHEYLLEFLMLFFAVFLGFLAENFREHQVEKHRIKQHMHTMVENLKYDTTRFGSVVRANVNRAKGLDSFRYQILEALQGRANGNKLYYYSWKFGRSYNFAVTNASAMTQLKSSGMLRLVKNDSLVAQMADYYERTYAGLDLGYQTVTIRRETCLETYKEFFSLVGFDEIIMRDTTYRPDGDPFTSKYFATILDRTPPLKLITDNKQRLQRLYADVVAFEITLRAYVARLRYSLDGAKNLMKNIKEEYHFE